MAPPANTLVKINEKIEPLPADADFGSCAIKLDAVLELFDTCAIRHNELVDHLNGLTVPTQPTP